MTLKQTKYHVWPRKCITLKYLTTLDSSVFTLAMNFEQTIKFSYQFIWFCWMLFTNLSRCMFMKIPNQNRRQIKLHKKHIQFLWLIQYDSYKKFINWKFIAKKIWQYHHRVMTFKKASMSQSETSWCGFSLIISTGILCSDSITSLCSFKILLFLLKPDVFQW